MKRRLFRQLTLIIIVGATCATLSGCAAFFPEARDITNVQLMQAMALDAGEEGQATVTVSSAVRPSAQGGTPEPPVILKWSAPTVFGACLTIQTFGDGYISLGHMEQCIIGKEAGRLAVNGLLDFIQRDFEMRTSMNLFATEGKAEDILTAVASETQSASDRLQSIEQDVALESTGWMVTVREFVSELADDGCALVPVLELAEEDEATTIRCDRMGIFRDQQFQGSLTPEQSRAAAILCDKAGSGACEVTLTDGSRVGLRLTSAECHWKPVWSGETLTAVTATVNVTADLAELSGGADIFSERVMDEMQRKLSSKLQRELMDVIRRAQQEQTDFLHIGRVVRLQCPSRYQVLEQSWKRWFPDLKLRVAVNSVVERSYDINRGEEIA